MPAKECVHGATGKCIMRCPHDNRCKRCGKCGDKPAASERMKACRCGRFIDKSWRVCGRCLEFERQHYQDVPLSDHRYMMREVIYQLNERTHAGT